MNCQDVEQSLVAYLNNEVCRSERELIRTHIAGCTPCQHELARLTALQSRVSNVLQSNATNANPSLYAWTRLKAQLTVEPESTLQDRLRVMIAYFAGGSLGKVVLPRFIVLATTMLVASAAMLVYSWRDMTLPTTATPASIQASPSIELRESQFAPSPVPGVNTVNTADALNTNVSEDGPIPVATVQPSTRKAVPMESRRISGPLDDAFAGSRANYVLSHANPVYAEPTTLNSESDRRFDFLTLLLTDDVYPYRACPFCTLQQ
jgi:hypothetical protein